MFCLRSTICVEKEAAGNVDGFKSTTWGFLSSRMLPLKVADYAVDSKPAH